MDGRADYGQKGREGRNPPRGRLLCARMLFKADLGHSSSQLREAGVSILILLSPKLASEMLSNLPGATQLGNDGAGAVTETQEEKTVGHRGGKLGTSS